MKHKNKKAGVLCACVCGGRGRESLIMINPLFQALRVQTSDMLPIIFLNSIKLQNIDLFIYETGCLTSEYYKPLHNI
jgi:hypothetical protein